jgi:hypothetical protein
MEIYQGTSELQPLLYTFVTYGGNCVSVKEVAASPQCANIRLFVGGKEFHLCGYEEKILYAYIGAIFL